MHILSIIRIVGLLVALFSSTMLLPAMVAFGYRDGGGAEFVSSFFIALLLGVLLWFPNRHHKKEVGVIALMTNNICSYIDTSLKGNLTTWTLDGHKTVQK